MTFTKDLIRASTYVPVLGSVKTFFKHKVESLHPNSPQILRQQQYLRFNPVLNFYSAKEHQIQIEIIQYPGQIQSIRPGRLVTVYGE